MNRPSDRVYLLPLLAALVTIVGSVGPWVAFHGFQIQAFDGERRVVSIAAGVAGALVFLAGQRGTPPSRWGVAVCGAVALGFSAWRFLHLVTNEQGADIGWGMWVSVVGSLALLVAAGSISRRS